MKAMRRLIWLTLMRYRWHAVATFVLTLGIGLVVAAAMPERWVAWADLYVHEPTTIHRLANPFTSAPLQGEGLKAIPHQLTSRERLVAMVKRADLVDQWDANRTPFQRAKDWAMERIRGPISEKDTLEALVHMLDQRLDVRVEKDHVEIAVEWSTRETAHQLLITAVEGLTAQRETKEIKVLEEAADALQDQLSGVQAEMVNRLNDVNAKVMRAQLEGRRAAVESDREQLVRDAERSAELLLRAEEKTISAEVMRRSNSLRFVMVRPALAPLRAEGPGRTMWSIIAVLVAVVASIASAFVMSILGGTVLTADQLERAVGFKVLARMPGQARVTRGGRSPWSIIAALGFAIASGVALGTSRGSIFFALAPTFLFFGAWALWTRPLKWPLLLLMLLAVTIDDPTDRPYVALWQSPTFALGRFFFTNVAWFTGFELAVMGLAVVMFLRRVSTTGTLGQSLDPASASSPRILRHTLVISGATVLWLVAFGVFRGGDFREALWQFRSLLMMPLICMLALHAFEFPRDLKLLAGVLVTGVVVKAALGTYFIYEIAYPHREYPPHTTGHNDTMIFVVATVLVFAMLWERPTWRKLGYLAVVMLFAGAAMRLNDRRIAYVDIAMVLAFVYAVSPMHRMKRFATQIGVAMLPVVALYIAAGWNAHGGIFKPVAKIRSIVAPAEDTEEESSNVERDIENFNITKSWERNMFFGQGFGHAFTEFTPSNDFAQSRFGHIGHNSVLWLLWIGGITGFTGVTLYLVVAVFLLGRSLPKITRWDERAAVLVALGIVLTYLMQAFGDMGMLSIQFDFFVAVAVAISGRLAISYEALRVPSDLDLSQNDSAFRQIRRVPVNQT